MNLQISFAVNRNYTTYSFYLNNRNPSPHSSFTFSDLLYLTELLYLTTRKSKRSFTCGQTQNTKFRFPYIRTEMNVMFSSIIFHFVFNFQLFQNMPFFNMLLIK